MRPLTFNTGYTITDYDNLIASRQFARAEAFTIYLPNLDRTYYYTDATRSFTCPPCDGSVPLRTYDATQVLITGFRFKASAGAARVGSDPTVSISVDEQTVKFAPLPGATLDNQPWLSAVAAGIFDAAQIRRDRWFFDRPGGPPICGMPMFAGIAASVDRLGRTEAEIKVKSQLILLDIPMPRNLYQPNCNHTIYDAGCKLVPADFSATGTVGDSPTTIKIPWSGAEAVYSIGKLTFETGANVGVSRTVRIADGSNLFLAYPLPFSPAAGDQFTVTQGCGRNYARCTALANTDNFRGFPFVPQSETAF